MNFPGATEADGVCVGEHVPESLAVEAAARIKLLERQLIVLRLRHAAQAAVSARLDAILYGPLAGIIEARNRFYADSENRHG